jgi:hypothetical protein
MVAVHNTIETRSTKSILADAERNPGEQFDTAQDARNRNPALRFCVG